MLFGIFVTIGAVTKAAVLSRLLCMATLVTLSMTKMHKLHVIWRETLVAGKFGESSLPLTKNYAAKL